MTNIHGTFSWIYIHIREYIYIFEDIYTYSKCHNTTDRQVYSAVGHEIWLAVHHPHGPL